MIMSEVWSMVLATGSKYIVDTDVCIQVTMAALQPKSGDQTDTITENVQPILWPNIALDDHVLCTLNYETRIQEIIEFHIPKGANFCLFQVEDSDGEQAQIHLTG